MRYKRQGSNQHVRKTNVHYVYYWAYMIIFFIVMSYILPDKTADAQIISPVATSTKLTPVEASNSASLVVEAIDPGQEKLELQKPTELEEIVSYITRVFEPEGKAVVVRAINCFYSESGLREDAVGQNNDGPKSKDHGVAQLNSYWHKLTEEEKTEYKANIERAYKIYKGRGGNFSAWYGKGCK